MYRITLCIINELIDILVNSKGLFNNCSYRMFICIECPYIFPMHTLRRKCVEEEEHIYLNFYLIVLFILLTRSVRQYLVYYSFTFILQAMST